MKTWVSCKSHFVFLYFHHCHSSKLQQLMFSVPTFFFWVFKDKSRPVFVVWIVEWKSSVRLHLMLSQRRAYSHNYRAHCLRSKYNSDCKNLSCQSVLTPLQQRKVRNSVYYKSWWCIQQSWNNVVCLLFKQMLVIQRYYCITGFF